MQAHNLPNLPDGTFDLDLLERRANPNEDDVHLAREESSQ